MCIRDSVLTFNKINKHNKELETQQRIYIREVCELNQNGEPYKYFTLLFSNIHTDIWREAEENVYYLYKLGCFLLASSYVAVRTYMFDIFNNIYLLYDELHKTDNNV